MYREKSAAGSQPQFEGPLLDGCPSDDPANTNPLAVQGSGGQVLNRMLGRLSQPPASQEAHTRSDNYRSVITGIGAPRHLHHISLACWKWGGTGLHVDSVGSVMDEGVGEVGVSQDDHRAEPHRIPFGRLRG